MRKINKTISRFLMMGALAVGSISCGDSFLDEVKLDAVSSDYLKEADGLVSMSETLYQQFRWLFQTESAYTYTNYGTDEFMVAGDNCNGMWNDYDARLGSTVTPRVNSNTQDNNTVWNNMYEYISRSNVIIAGADLLKGDAKKEEALGVAYFLRGFDYLFLTMQYGDVPLVLERATVPTREYTRNAQKEVYAQIISDLENAYNLLPEKASAQNKLSKYAAAHYLAKAHLWRASEINDGWNGDTQSADLTAVVKYADEVIAAHPLTENYEDLFGNFVDFDTSITETNSEIVLAASFSGHDTNFRGGNMMLCNATNWYQGFLFMKRDIAGAREYQRFKATPSYTYYLYDLKNDSRFWKSFKTTYAINDNGKGKNPDITLGDGTVTKPQTYYPSNNGEYMAAMYIINREDYGQKYYQDEVNVAKGPKAGSFTRIDYRTDKYIPVIMALNIYDENDNVVGTSMTPDYNTLACPINKYLDGAVHANNLGNGSRDGVLARSAEDYFFKAEALIRQGQIDAGLAVLKPLRDRAQYKAGEERDAYVDGGQAYHTNQYKATLKNYDAHCAFYPMNSYYYSIGLDQREVLDGTASTLPAVTSSSYPEEDQKIMDKLGYSSAYDKAMCYLLNEKSREMYGELLRWMDLARTKTLEKRLVFNDQAYSKNMTDITGSTTTLDGGATYTSANGGSFKANTHYYRPIPQSFLDNITKDGKPLTEAEKAALQNPGY